MVQLGAARPRGRILGIETQLAGELLPQVPPILGRLDLLVDEGQQLAVLDFKTARAPWSRDQVREHSGQLHLYHELLRPLTQGKPIRLEFVVLTKTRVSKLICHDVPADGRSIGWTRQIVARAWDAMQSGVVHPTPSLRQCPTCPFRQVCDARSG